MNLLNFSIFYWLNFKYYYSRLASLSIFSTYWGSTDEDLFEELMLIFIPYFGSDCRTIRDAFFDWELLPTSGTNSDFLGVKAIFFI